MPGCRRPLVGLPPALYCGEFTWLWGCLAGLVELRTKPGKWEGPLAILAGVALIVACRRPLTWMEAGPGVPAILGSLSGFGLGSGLVVFGLWRTDSPWIVWPLAWRPVAYLGRISYGLYVYHLLAIDRNWVMYIPEYYLIPEPYGVLLATIAVASASWYLFESPINRLKDRLTDRPVSFEPSRSPVVPRERQGSGD